MTSKFIRQLEARYDPAKPICEVGTYRAAGNNSQAIMSDRIYFIPLLTHAMYE